MRREGEGERETCLLIYDTCRKAQISTLVQQESICVPPVPRRGYMDLYLVTFFLNFFILVLKI
jgi:hypothetical protein